MPADSVPLSARIPKEDAEFLNEYTAEGAKTPSEKLRAIVGDARRRSQGTRDYRSALESAEKTLGPALKSIREAERELELHSEMVTRVAEWLPEAMAYVQSAPSIDGDDKAAILRRIEGGLALRVVTLMQSLLQLGVTHDGPFYNPGLLEDRLDAVLDLADVIRARRAAAADKQGGDG